MKRPRKDPVDPDRIRSIPSEGFSWIDRRFVREGFIDPLPREPLLLYFFLTAVSDAEGLSFYGVSALQRLLKLTAPELKQARRSLIDRDLILYRHPIYQVLPVPKQVKQSPPAATVSTLPPSEEVTSHEEGFMSLREYYALIGRDRPGGGTSRRG
jgi:hypothetical protein